MNNKNLDIISENCLNKKKSNTCITDKFEVVDLFCGIGGLSYGMKSIGFKILAGYDLDKTCQYPQITKTYNNRSI